MTYTNPPKSVRSLEQRIRNATARQEETNRFRHTLALVIVSQMLPEGAIKGGSAMALRYGRSSRHTRDLDAAHAQPLDDFRAAFAERLREGWEGFTGRLIPARPPRPIGVPAVYVMQPFDVKLSYRGVAWCTVRFELGHNEIGDAEEPEYHLARELVQMFADLQLPMPEPVPVMNVYHQIAQKLHALSSPQSDRARDLVDLQLLIGQEEIDYTRLATTCQRLFSYRSQQPWVPHVMAGDQWDSLYEEAKGDLPLLPDAESAVSWVNDLISRIANSGPPSN